MLAAVPLLVAGCSETAITSTPPVPNRYPKLGIPTKDGQPDLSVVSIIMSRGPCFGSCPVYEITLAGSGEGGYVGESFVVREGPLEFRFDPAELLPVLDELEQLDFMRPPVSEDGTGNDAQTTWTTLNIGARSSLYGTFWFQNFGGDPDQKRADFNRRYASVVAGLDRVARIETLIGDAQTRRQHFESR